MVVVIVVIAVVLIIWLSLLPPRELARMVHCVLVKRTSDQCNIDPTGTSQEQQNVKALEKIYGKSLDELNNDKRPCSITKGR
jgi:hypothetical protein